MFTIGAFAIIWSEQGDVLLCHRRDMDLWSLPGGRVETAELPTEAAIREVREETGLDVVIERLIGVYGKAGQDELVFSFVCRVVGGEITLTEESNDTRYWSAEALPPNTIPKQVERIRDALIDQPPLFRRQTGPLARDWLRPQEVH